MTIISKLFKKKPKVDDNIVVELPPINTNILPEHKDETILETKEDIESKTTSKRDVAYSIITNRRLKILKVLRNRQLKHSQIERVVGLTHSSCHRQLKILMGFGYINRIEMEVPTIAKRSLCYDIKTKKMKVGKTAYFYDLTKKGIDALDYWDVVK